MRIVVAGITIAILLLIGHAVKTAMVGGWWWAPSVVIAGALYLGYLVGDDDDRQGYKDAWQRLTGLLRR